jgi:Flp pilus assembly protein CpaB
VSESGPVTITRPVSANGAPSGRIVRRRRSLPGGRAVVGGLLVAATAVGVFAATGAARHGPSTSYVVVVNDIPAGHVLTSADLKLVAIDLPSAQRRVSFSDPRVLIGNVAVARLKDGQIVQSADVADARRSRHLAEISVPVEPSSAMNGEHEYLHGGDRVDVIATFTQGGTPITRTVARSVLVVDVLSGARGLGTNGRLTVVLAVAPRDLEPIATASAAAKITLARTTGVAR